MQYIFWNEHFDVGYPPFNEQHKEIFRLQNKVVNLLCGDAGPRELSPVLNRLIRYCESHFREEETLMEQYGYTDLPAHRQEHERLVMHIFSLAEELDKVHFNRERLLVFLNTWITSHIMKVDMGYRQFFQQKLGANEHRKKDETTAATDNSLGPAAAPNTTEKEKGSK